MKSKPLVCVEVVTDDETGIWSIGELEHSIYLDNVETFLGDYADGRQRLGDRLRILAHYFETGKWPYEGAPPQRENTPCPTKVGIDERLVEKREAE